MDDASAYSRLVLRALPLIALVAAVAGFSSAPAHALAPLPTRLTKALHGRGDTPTGAVVVERASGKIVFSQNASRAFVPASNQKLLVAFALLYNRQPSERIETVVIGHGRKVGRVWQGDITIKGYGDPTLTTGALRQMARALKARGIDRINGHLYHDESFFDSRRTAPGWKRSFYINECPPLSALIIDYGRKDGKLLHTPSFASGRHFYSALKKEGVTVQGFVLKRRAAGGKVLVTRTSPPLSKLIEFMSSESDNFYAEMLLKYLAARETGKGTTAQGVAVVRRTLLAHNISLRGLSLHDGSGLSRSNRLTPQATVQLLAAAHRSPLIWEPFRASLAVAGRKGTLERRMTTGPARNRVFAKTGYTRLASALSGYVGERYIFSVFINGDPLAYQPARVRLDRFGQALSR